MTKKNRYASDSAVAFEEMQLPSLVPGEVMRMQSFRKGLLQFSRTYFMPEGKEQPDEALIDRTKLGLPWQGLTELQEDHGLGVTHGILLDAGLGGLHGDKSIDEMSRELCSKIGENKWADVERFLNRIGPESDPNGHRKAFITACWADAFEEPFGDVWLAAMAQHAYYVLEDDFAFGYLTALIDQKTHNERDFLRGKKGMDSAKAGGAARAEKIKPETQARLAKMRNLIAGGHSRSRAAELANKAGYGPSADANRRLWARHNACARTS